MPTSNSWEGDNYKEEPMDRYWERRQEETELKESMKDRRQCAIEKVKNILHLPLVDLYIKHTENLNIIQRLVILQLIRRIIECEDKIPKEFWCENCKRKDKRIKDLIKRFLTMNKNNYNYKTYSETVPPNYYTGEIKW